MRRVRGEKAAVVSSGIGPTTPDHDPRHGRAASLTYEFSKSRRDAPLTTTTTDHARELANLAVPEFCDSCVIELVRDGVASVIAARRSSCELKGPDHLACCARDLESELADSNEAVARAMVDGTLAVVMSSDGETRMVVVPLRHEGCSTGVVIMTIDEDRTGFQPVDVGAVEEATWTLAAAWERSSVNQTSREAVRQTQRIASQLHQLIAVSLTVASLHDESDILTSLAESTRGVFNADLAVVALGERRGVAARGSPAHIEAAGEGDEMGRVPNVHARDTRVIDDWMVTPILRRRDRVQGFVGVRRTAGPAFGDEDREVVTLLAQMASTSLGAAELTRAIQTSETRLRVLIDAAPVGIIEVDPLGAIRWWNSAASRIFEWDDFVDAGSRAATEFPSDTRDGFGELWDELRRGAPAATRDFVDVAIGGRLRFLTASAAPLPALSGSRGGVLTLVDDVTDHRQLQSEIRHAHTMETRGQVASKIAHDFNNLLTLITGYAEMLSLDVTGNERAAQMVRGIQATTSRASLLTTQLQSIGRTKPTEPVVFGPASVIRSNAEVLDRILGANVELRLSLAAETGNVFADPDQFEQLVLNLALNARDAMPDGGVLRVDLDEATFEAAAERPVTPGRYLRLVVADNGLGMDPSTLERCFEPLFTTKGPFNGTGLGLAAARRFVDESGGAITGRSVLGEGTTFEVVLPRVDGVTSDVATSVVREPRRSATILVVEDEDSLRGLMNQVLRRHGYDVLEASSAEAALEVYESRDVQVLVSDVMMGAMTGTELAITLQARQTGLRVLLISGTESPSVLDALDSTASAFLAKPFKPSALIEKLDHLLSP